MHYPARANSVALHASPMFSIVPGVNGVKCGRLRFSSMRELHHAVIQYGRTENESTWKLAKHIDLGEQTLADFDQTGIARKALSVLESTKTRIIPSQFKPASIRAAVTGGVWNIPAVMANLPLSARTRVRDKIAPKNIRLAIDITGDVSPKQGAELIARIGAAIWAYQLAGGVVTLDVISYTTSQHPAYKLSMIETRVNASDIAALATAVSCTGMRALQYAMLSALSPCDRDGLPVLYTRDLPGQCVYMAGNGSNLLEGARELEGILQIV